MTKCIVFLLSWIICCFCVHASDSLRISLMTCSVGEQLYATFGHSALRVNNLKTGKDQVYNFGMFNPNTPCFQFRFIQGEAQYQLGIQSFDDFLQIYQDENRLVMEQVLDLTQKEKEIIIRRLAFLYLPENRYYFYKFGTDNCTTALRDLIFDAISFDTSCLESRGNTFRQLINECLEEKPWLQFGVNLLLGSKSDKRINGYESMFLPEQLRMGLNKIERNGYKLVVEEKMLNTIEQDGSIKYQNIFSPFLLLSMLFLLTLFFYKSEYLKSVVFAFVGILGIIVLIITLFTEHRELMNNFNLLWFNPLYIVSSILIKQKDLRKQKFLAYCNLVLTLIAIIFWIIGIQSYQWTFIPLILLLSVYNMQIIKRKTNVII